MSAKYRVTVTHVVDVVVSDSLIKSFGEGAVTPTQVFDRMQAYAIDTGKLMVISDPKSKITTVSAHMLAGYSSVTED